MLRINNNNLTQFIFLVICEGINRHLSNDRIYLRVHIIKNMCIVLEYKLCIVAYIGVRALKYIKYNDIIPSLKIIIIIVIHR